MGDWIWAYALGLYLSQPWTGERRSTSSAEDTPRPTRSTGSSPSALSVTGAIDLLRHARRRIA
jgi:hypothetical protein